MLHAKTGEFRIERRDRRGGTGGARRVVACLGVAAWLAVLPAAAQERHPQQRMSAPSGTSDVHLPDGVDHIKLPLKTDSEYIVLPISVNGSDPLPMVLDTGMPVPGIALFDGEHLEKLDLEYLPMPAQIGGAGGDASASRLASR